MAYSFFAKNGIPVPDFRDPNSDFFDPGLRENLIPVPKQSQQYQKVFKYIFFKLFK